MIHFVVNCDDRGEAPAYPRRDDLFSALRLRRDASSGREKRRRRRVSPRLCWMSSAECFGMTTTRDVWVSTTYNNIHTMKRAHFLPTVSCVPMYIDSKFERIVIEYQSNDQPLSIISTYNTFDPRVEKRQPKADAAKRCWPGCSPAQAGTRTPPKPVSNKRALVAATSPSCVPVVQGLPSSICIGLGRLDLAGRWDWLGVTVAI